jgi:hypothetical protein
VKGNFQAITAKEAAIIVRAIFVQRSTDISSSILLPKSITDGHISALSNRRHEGDWTTSRR